MFLILLGSIDLSVKRLLVHLDMGPFTCWCRVLGKLVLLGILCSVFGSCLVFLCSVILPPPFSFSNVLFAMPGMPILHST